MSLTDFDYSYPDNLVAHHPLPEREASRLMHIDRASAAISTEHTVANLPDFLNAGDVVVINTTKVFPARLMGQKESGGEIEILLLTALTPDQSEWRAMATKLKRLKVGMRLSFGDTLHGEIIAHNSETVDLRFDHPDLIMSVGLPPLPPYIHRDYHRPEEFGADRERYQTVFAQTMGSAAAPTAGLHLTEAIFKRLRDKGVTLASVTLHVGRDTFQPVRVDDPTTHVMHGEWFEVPSETANAINHAKAGGHRVMAVGTTSVRALESCTRNSEQQLISNAGITRLFIYPGYRFHTVDMMMTNFHQPKSTLLMLVSAFASRDLIRTAYARAIDEDFRLFSYGDCMVVE